MSRIIGIDYSLSCPCACVLSEDKSFIKSEVFYLTSTKKYADNWNNILGVLQKPYKNFMERYGNNADFFIERLQPKKDDVIFIEDYAMHSIGRTFDLAENAGILKYKLYQMGVNAKIISPTVIKMFFHGKGNADKNKMYEAFVSRTNIDLRKLFGCYAKKLPSPITDIVDAWALALTGDSL